MHKDFWHRLSLVMYTKLTSSCAFTGRSEQYPHRTSSQILLRRVCLTIYEPNSKNTKWIFRKLKEGHLFNILIFLFLGILMQYDSPFLERTAKGLGI